MFTRPIAGPRAHPRDVSRIVKRRAAPPPGQHKPYPGEFTGGEAAASIDAQGFYGVDLRDDLPLVTPTMSSPPPHVVYDPTSPTGTFNLPTRSGFIPMPPNPFAQGAPRRR